MPNDTLHSWLRGCLPADVATILEELIISHAAKVIPATWPRDGEQLSEALRELEGQDLVEKRDATWFWLSDEKVKVEPQMELFA